MKSLVIITILVICLIGCAGKALNYEMGKGSGAVYPDVTFAVISDLHLYDPVLGSKGEAFEKTMNSDRKLLLDSIDLLDFALEKITASGARFLLISGDLTKDGELINHTKAAQKLRDANIAVYVVPGNHDINNPGAVKYSGDSTEAVASVSAQDFARIYGDFGFNAAVMRDDDSLSYVVEPVDGLWLLAVDDCRYRENTPGKEEIVSGKISQKTADWIASALHAAAEQNKAVMVMMHHGVVEHWKGQAKLHPDYLIQDYQNFGDFLASWNVRLVFSGHYHAQDITRADFDNQNNGSGNDSKFLYDIETGSLVTAPCPIRYIDIKNNSVQIRTLTLAGIIHPDTDFAANAQAFVKKTVMLEAASVLKKYLVRGNDIEYITNAVGDAFSAHYSGDENPALRPPFDKSKLNFWGRFVYGQQQYILDGLWEDLPPADNNVYLNLR
jgi:DNA repair exonuclease SbcCD nuclease subunit